MAGKGGARGSWLFDAAPANRSSVRAFTLSRSPIAKLRAKDDERRQAKRNSLADKLTVEAKTLADLKVEKAAVESERRKVEADWGQSNIWRLCWAEDDEALRYFHPRFRAAPGPWRLGSDADTVVSAKAQDGVQEGRRPTQHCRR